MEKQSKEQMANMKDIIIKLKKIRDERNLKNNTIMQMVKANGDYLSKTTISRVFADGKGIITVEKSLYIRSSDSKNGEIQGTYKNGDIVTLLHQSGNTGWYLTPKGWISNNYVQVR